MNSPASLPPRWLNLRHIGHNEPTGAALPELQRAFEPHLSPEGRSAATTLRYPPSRLAAQEGGTEHANSRASAGHGRGGAMARGSCRFDRSATPSTGFRRTPADAPRSERLRVRKSRPRACSSTRSRSGAAVQMHADTPEEDVSSRVPSSDQATRILSACTPAMAFSSKVDADAASKTRALPHREAMASVSRVVTAMSLP